MELKPDSLIYSVDPEDTYLYLFPPETPQEALGPDLMVPILKPRDTSFSFETPGFLITERFWPQRLVADGETVIAIPRWTEDAARLFDAMLSAYALTTTESAHSGYPLGFNLVTNGGGYFGTLQVLVYRKGVNLGYAGLKRLTMGQIGEGQ